MRPEQGLYIFEEEEFSVQVEKKCLMAKKSLNSLDYFNGIEGINDYGDDS